jgi:hypothetical protein
MISDFGDQGLMTHRLDNNSGITIDKYNYTFNPPKPLNACKRRCQEQEQCDSFPGQLSSAYGGALFTLAIVKYSSSPSVAPT